MDPQSFDNPFVQSGNEAPPHPEHPVHPGLPPTAAPYDDGSGWDPMGWWEVIGRGWRWVTNPNA